MNPPRYQFSLVEMMGLVAVCALGSALLPTVAAPLGVGLIVIVPGFALERARGGTGIIGGTISGCILPVGLAEAPAMVGFPSGHTLFAESLVSFPGIYPLFFGCLIWSYLSSCILHLIYRTMPGYTRSSKRATEPVQSAVQSVTDDDRPGPFL